jgi:hypothetical protein
MRLGDGMERDQLAMPHISSVRQSPSPHYFPYPKNRLEKNIKKFPLKTSELQIYLPIIFSPGKNLRRNIRRSSNRRFGSGMQQG